MFFLASRIFFCRKFSSECQRRAGRHTVIPIDNTYRSFGLKFATTCKYNFIPLFLFQAYLDQFGYTRKTASSKNSLTVSSLSEDIRRFQTTFGLSPSGVLDHDTLELMGRERCGNQDVEAERESGWEFPGGNKVHRKTRKKRFATKGCLSKNRIHSCQLRHAESFQ